VSPFRISPLDVEGLERGPRRMEKTPGLICGIASTSRDTPESLASVETVLREESELRELSLNLVWKRDLQRATPRLETFRVGRPSRKENGGRPRDLRGGRRRRG
jgi:hypothetical protein